MKIKPPYGLATVIEVEVIGNLITMEGGLLSSFTPIFFHNLSFLALIWIYTRKDQVTKNYITTEVIGSTGFTRYLDIMDIFPIFKLTFSIKQDGIAINDLQRN